MFFFDVAWYHKAVQKGEKLMPRIALCALIGIFSWGVAVFGQTTVPKPDLPADYQKWPNVFRRQLVLDGKNTLVYTLWARLLSRQNLEKQSIETVVVQKINGVIIATTSIQAVESNPVKIFATDYLLVDDGYLKIDAQTSREQKQALLNRFQKAIQKKFGLDDAALSIVYNLFDLFKEDFLKFMERLVESPKP